MFPSFPAQKSSDLTLSSGWQQSWGCHTLTVPRASRKTTSFPGFKERCSFPQEGPHADTSSPSIGQSDHMARTEPISNKGWQPNKPNPAARVWLLPCFIEGGHLCKTEALFGRRRMLHRHQTPSSIGLPASARHRPEITIGHPEDKPSQKT